MLFGYLDVTDKLRIMLTSIEIATILAAQNKKKANVKSGFDAALEGLGVKLKSLEIEV